MRKTVLLAVVFTLAAAGLSQAQPVTGYLKADAVDEPRVLPAPPEKGSPRSEADRAVFRATRALAGSPRWDAATIDAQEGTANMLRNFSCALGVHATPEALPKLTRLFDRAVADVANANNTGKVYFKRQRPPANDPGAICHPLAAFDMTRDYPSGHASRGWLFALILTELAPDRGNALLTRGRAYGESRVVCGVHNATSIEAGRVVGASVVANLHSSAAFRADMDAVRAELSAFRAAAPPMDAAACAAQAALLEPSPFR